MIQFILPGFSGLLRRSIPGLLFLIIISSCSDQREAPFGISSDSVQLFEKVDAELTGIRFNNLITEDEKNNYYTFPYYYNGAGVSVGDINNDGLPDLYFVGNMIPNKMYLNKGNFEFEDITVKANLVGLGPVAWETGVTMADVNGDGFLDIYLCRSGLKGDRKNSLFINNGDLTFTDRAREYGLADDGFSTHSAFFDYDLDGDLDMYLTNHPMTFHLSDEEKTRFQQQTPKEFADKLYQNQGSQFVDVTQEAGIPYFHGYGLSNTIADINNDGWPDIFVTNDFTEPDVMFINQQDGTFKEGIQATTRHISLFSMGSDIADFDNDGWMDILVVDMMAEDHRRQKSNMSAMNPKKFWNQVNKGYHYQYMQNVLQRNNQNGTFSDVAQMAGLHFTDWSWSPQFADFDNDGWKDAYITNGIIRETRNNDQRIKRDSILKVRPNISNLEMLDLMPSEKIPNYLYKNQGDYTFGNNTQTWGLNEPGFSTASVYADLDNDGDLDLVVHNNNSEAWLYQNKEQERVRNHYLKVSLEGDQSNTFGLGSRVEVYADGKKQVQELTLSRGYLSSVEPKLHFGMGDISTIDSLTVTWPGQKIQVLKNVKTDQHLTLKYEDAEDKKAKATRPKYMLTQVAEQLNLKHKHIENEFDDYARQVLLPHKMSQFGPPMAVGDIDGDGDEDLFVGGSVGSAGVIFKQNQKGTFDKIEAPFFARDKDYEDMGAVFFDIENDGDLDLYMSSGGNEYEAYSNKYQDRLYLNDGRGNFKKDNKRIPDLKISSSQVRAADYDQDGDMDLFVGGRLVPGQYPQPESSYLLENRDGTLINVTDEIAEPLKNIGLVTDAIWTDINNDKQLDLVLVGEWMPVTILMNSEGQFTDQTEAYGLSKEVGWWYSINQGDFDGDGDIDLVGGNLGLNYKYKASHEAPFYVFSDDFDQNEAMDIVLANSGHGELYPVRGRECSSQQIPGIKKKFKNYDLFSNATLQDIYGESNLDNSLSYGATYFASCFLENIDGEEFELSALPSQAQFSSVNGIISEDVNGDGILDLVISGNLHPVEVETLRNDASIGLVLTGNGDGTFEALDAGESGYFTPGDVKNLAMINTQLGKVVLVASNNDYMQAFLLNNK